MTNYVLIPSYCPDAHLTGLLQELSKAGFACVVVDDGSSPEYQEIFMAAEPYCTMLCHPRNLGKGAALRTGLEWIRRHGSAEDIIVTADGDGQHTADDILRCAQISQRFPGALVLGCRSFDGSVPAHNRLGNQITAGMFQLLTGRKLSDTQTGLRAFRGALIPMMLAAKGDRYEYEMNVLLDCIPAGIPYQEVPIRTIYEDGNRSSHFHVLRDSLLICRQLLKFAASSAASFCVDYSLFLLFSLPAVSAAQVLYANVAARIFSATFNYELNRRCVFVDQSRRQTTWWKYALLAGFILCLNTAILSLMIEVLGISRYAAKLLTEAVLFFFSWALQKNVVFSRPANVRRISDHEAQ